MSLAGCSDDEDIQPAQKEKIVSFLTGTHAPRLVAEENLEEGSNQPRLQSELGLGFCDLLNVAVSLHSVTSHCSTCVAQDIRGMMI